MSSSPWLARLPTRVPAPAELGARMDVAGSVDVLAFGFDTQEPLMPELAQHLDRLRGRGILRILDVLFVSKDSHGTFRAHRGDADLDAASAVPAPRRSGSFSPTAAPSRASSRTDCSGNSRSWEVGLDLDWIERLGVLIEPGTSALLMLVQAKWATDLLDTRSPVRRVSDRVRVPRAGDDARRRPRPRRGFGRRARGRARRRAARCRDARSARDGAGPRRRVATQVIAALLDARLLDECEVDAAVGVLAAEGLVPPRLLAQARADADATIADVSPLPLRSLETEG